MVHSASQLVDTAIFALISGFNDVSVQVPFGNLSLADRYTKKDFLPQLLHTDTDFADKLSSLWLNKATWETKYGHVKWGSYFPWISATDAAKAIKLFERDYAKDLPEWLRDDAEALKTAILVVSAKYVVRTIVQATDLTYIPKARTFIYSKDKGSMLASELMDVTHDDIINYAEVVESIYNSDGTKIELGVSMLEKIGGAKKRRQVTEIRL